MPVEIPLAPLIKGEWLKIKFELMLRWFALSGNYPFALEKGEEANFSIASCFKSVKSPLP